MRDYTFQGMSYPTHERMMGDFARAFLGDTTPPETLEEALALADEAIEGWGLTVTNEDRPVSWMDQNRTTREDIADALIRYAEREL